MIGNDKNWIKAYIVDVLPCISIAFFVLAYIYNTTFYSAFGIDIVQYASFGDIFITITEPLIYYAIFAALMMSAFVELYKVTLPNCIENQKQRKQKPLRFPKAYFTCMRFLVKIKQYLLRALLLSRTKKQAEQSVLMLIVISLMFFSICALAYDRLIGNGDIDPTLNSLTFALLIPVLLFFMFSSVSVASNPKKELLIMKGYRKRPVKMVVLIACYYFYAIVVFSVAGEAAAKKILNDNEVEFEVATTEGTVFNDGDYCYVGHISGVTFLYNREVKNNVIIGNDGIVYTKINTQIRNKKIRREQHLKDVVRDFW